MGRAALSEPVEQRRPRVVVADDAPDARLLSRLVLERAGYEVVAQASDGVELLRLARSAQPDLVLADVAMPRLDGIAAALALREYLPNTGIVLVAGFEQQRLAQQAVAVGADAYVEKGAPTRVLLDVLERLAPGRARPAQPIGTDEVPVESLYSLLLDALSEAVVVLRADAVVRSANPAAGVLFGRPLDEIVGSPWASLGALRVDDDVPAGADSVVLRAARTGEGMREERRDGSIRLVRATVRPLMRPGGDILGAVACARRARRWAATGTT